MTFRFAGSIIACLCVAASCAESPTALETGGADLSHKPNHGGGGGSPPGGSSGVPVELDSFTGAMSVTSAPLIHGVNFAEAEIVSDGRLSVDSYAGNPNRGDPVVHRVCFDLSILSGSVLSPADLTEFTQLIEGDLSQACGWGRLHTRDHSNEGKMLGQVSGTVEHSGGKFVYKEFDSKKGSWDWRIIFDTNGSLNLPDEGKGVCIDRTDDNNWSVYSNCIADDGSIVDDVVQLWRFNDGPARQVADFVAEFGFVVTRLP